LVGGGTRIPKLQQSLKDVVQRSELAQNLNTDEAPVFGSFFFSNSEL